MSLLPYIVVRVLLIIKNSFKQKSILNFVITIFTYLSTLRFDNKTGSNIIAAGFIIFI